VSLPLLSLFPSLLFPLDLGLIPSFRLFISSRLPQSNRQAHLVRRSRESSSSSFLLPLSLFLFSFSLLPSSSIPDSSTHTPIFSPLSCYQDISSEGQGQATAGGLGAHTGEKKPLDFQGVSLTERWDENIGKVAEKVSSKFYFFFSLHSECSSK